MKLGTFPADFIQILGDASSNREQKGSKTPRRTAQWWPILQDSGWIKRTLMAQIVRLSDRQMAARVKRGACLLDKHRPGWEREIDLKRLGLLENDVLSQLYADPINALHTLGFGSVRDYLEQLYTEIPATTFRCGSLADYGFAAFREDGSGEWRQAYHELRRLWRSEVRSRLAPASGGSLIPPLSHLRVSHGPL